MCVSLLFSHCEHAWNMYIWSKAPLCSLRFSIYIENETGCVFGVGNAKKNVFSTFMRRKSIDAIKCVEMKLNFECQKEQNECIFRWKFSRQNVDYTTAIQFTWKIERTENVRQDTKQPQYTRITLTLFGIWFKIQPWISNDFINKCQQLLSTI